MFALASFVIFVIFYFGFAQYFHLVFVCSIFGFYDFFFVFVSFS